jgi:hypothetical protein
MQARDYVVRLATLTDPEAIAQIHHQGIEERIGTYLPTTGFWKIVTMPRQPRGRVRERLS